MPDGNWDYGGTGFLPGYGPEGVAAAPSQAAPATPLPSGAIGLRQALDQVWQTPMPNGRTIGQYLQSLGNDAPDRVFQAMFRYQRGDVAALQEIGRIMDGVWRTGDPPIYQQVQGDPRVQSLADAWTRENDPNTPSQYLSRPYSPPTSTAMPVLTNNGPPPTLSPANAAPLDPNSAFQPAPTGGAPFTLTGPGAETPFGQVAGQVMGRGYLPAFNFLQLMAEAEHQRLADEQQRLINAASIAAQNGNMDIAAQNASAARDVAQRQQALAEQVQRAKIEVERLNSATQRDVTGREMSLREAVTPYEATTARMVGMAPLATSPLVNWYTARGEAPPQAILDLLRNATQTPGSADASLYPQSVSKSLVGVGNTAGGSVPFSSVPANPDPNMLYAFGGPSESPAIPSTPGKTLDGTMNLMSPLRQTQSAGASTGGAPFIRALNTGATLPSFTGSVGQFAPPLPGGAQWTSMTPGERSGTTELFKSFGIPNEDFMAMLQKSLPPGGDVGTAARFATAVR
mgnify:CR=1 FL=1